MTRADLRKKTGISPAIFAKMSKGETIGANVLECICATAGATDTRERVPPESEIPVVSIKVPTGGGKTIIAAHAIKVIAE